MGQAQLRIFRVGRDPGWGRQQCTQLPLVVVEWTAFSRTLARTCSRKIKNVLCARWPSCKGACSTTSRGKVKRARGTRLLSSGKCRACAAVCVLREDMGKLEEFCKATSAATRFWCVYACVRSAAAWYTCRTPRVASVLETKCAYARLMLWFLRFFVRCVSAHRV